MKTAIPIQIVEILPFDENRNPATQLAFIEEGFLPSVSSAFRGAATVEVIGEPRPVESNLVMVGFDNYGRLTAKP